MYMAADLENINDKRLSCLKTHSRSVYVWGKATKFNNIRNNILLYSNRANIGG